MQSKLLWVMRTFSLCWIFVYPTSLGAASRGGKTDILVQGHSPVFVIISFWVGSFSNFHGLRGFPSMDHDFPVFPSSPKCLLIPFLEDRGPPRTACLGSWKSHILLCLLFSTIFKASERCNSFQDYTVCCFCITSVNPWVCVFLWAAICIYWSGED